MGEARGEGNYTRCFQRGALHINSQPRARVHALALLLPSPPLPPPLPSPSLQYRPGGAAAGVTPLLRDASALLAGGNIPHELAEDLVMARWKKLVWNVPFNSLSALKVRLKGPWEALKGPRRALRALREALNVPFNSRSRCALGALQEALKGPNSPTALLARPWSTPCRLNLPPPIRRPLPCDPLLSTS